MTKDTTYTITVPLSFQNYARANLARMSAPVGVVLILLAASYAAGVDRFSILIALPVAIFAIPALAAYKFYQAARNGIKELIYTFTPTALQIEAPGNSKAQINKETIKQIKFRRSFVTVRTQTGVLNIPITFDQKNALHQFLAQHDYALRR